MKIRATLFALLFLVLLAPSASATSSHEIILVEPTHRNFAGKLVDDELTTLLAPDGRLGKLLFFPAAQPRIWLIDASLIDDVKAMPEENLVAQNWLRQLQSITNQDVVKALAYGHPNLHFASRLAPSELQYYFVASQSRLEDFLKRKVTLDTAAQSGVKVSVIPDDAVQSYMDIREEIAFITTVIPVSELDSLRAHIASLLVLDLSKERQATLASDARAALAAEKHKLRIIAGKYRLTSENEKVPVTIVNDFAQPIVVTLHLSSENPRVQVKSVRKITLPPHSKTQLSIPITVIASGNTSLTASLVNVKGRPIVEPTILTLSVSVISPAVAWFTTGAAILLFLGAIAQSVRRVRRSRK